MAFVDERVAKAEDVMLIMRVVIFVQHLQYCDLHHALVEISRLILDNLDSNDFICPNVLALDDLPEGSLTENIENKISKENLSKVEELLRAEDLLVPIFTAQEIVDIENIIVIVIVITIVMRRLAGLRKNSSRVCGRLVRELGVAPVESGRDIGRESFEGL